MFQAFSRSSFAYATFLFVVLFAPQVGIEHHVDRVHRIHSISMFPDVFTFVLSGVILWLAVRQATAGRTEQVFELGVARGSAVSVIGGLLYAIALAIIGPMIYDNGLFSIATAVIGFLIVSVAGSALSALFARQRARNAATAARPKPA